MKNDLTVSQMEMAEILCTQMYDFFSTNKYTYRHDISETALNCYLSILNDTFLYKHITEYLLNNVLKGKVVRLHPENYRRSCELDVVQIIEDDREKALAKMTKSLSLKRTFPEKLTKDLKEGSLLRVVVEVLAENKEAISPINTIYLFENCDLLNEDTLYSAYLLLKTYVGEEILNKVVDNYERDKRLHIPLEELITETYKTTTPIPKANAVVHTINILNLFRYQPRVGKENAFVRISYLISTLCNGYVKESFIYDVLNNLTSMGIIELSRENYFGDRYYTLSEHDLKNLQERAYYVVDNIGVIASMIEDKCPEPYKESMSNPPMFELFRLLFKIEIYREMHNGNILTLYKLTEKLMYLDGISGSDKELFLDLLYSLYQDSELVNKLWIFYMERYLYYYPNKVLTYKPTEDEVIDQMKIRNKAYSKYISTFNSELLNTVVSLDERYMTWYVEIIKEDLRNISFPEEILERHDLVTLNGTTYHCKELIIYFTPSKIDKSLLAKAHFILSERGFEYDEDRDGYSYKYFSNSYIYTDISYVGDNFYISKFFLEDNNVEILKSDMKTKTFECNIPIKVYEKLSKSKEWKMFDYGGIYIDI